MELYASEVTGTRFQWHEIGSGKRGGTDRKWKKMAAWSHETAFV